MKCKLLEQIWYMTKLVFYGTVIQCFMLSVIFAADINAQRKSIDDIHLDLDLKNSSIKKALKVIEKETGLYFAYSDSSIDKNVKIDYSTEDASLRDVLRYLAKKSNLQFKRVNETINVSMNVDNQLSVTEMITIVQGREVTGRVISQEDNDGLPGVNVIVKGTSQGSVTDVEGNYKVEVPDESSTLVFSSVGFISEEVTVGQQSIIDMVMVADLTALDEIVVIGYGEQKKANLTGSIVTVNAADFENRVVSNPIQALQGKVAGLRVAQTTGTPGNEGLTFQIRGVNSFSSDPSISSVVKNQPLILINGIVGDLTTLDPSFIESITVLKDAASASIYGARAANGVILVTTKSGAGQKGLNVSYTGRVMTQSRINLLERFRESVDFMELVNDVVAPFTGRFYSDEVINNFKNNPSDEFPNFDHEKFYIRNVTIQNHNIQIGGSTGKTNYNIGLGFWNQDGITKGFGYKRLNALFNIESQVNDFVKIGIYASGVDGKRIEPYNGERDYLMGILSQSPTYKPTLLDGSGRYTGSNGGSEPESQGYADIASKNALAISDSENARIYDNSFNINSNVFMDVTLLKGLTWYSKVGIDITQTDWKRRRPVLRMYSYRSGEFQGNLDNIGTEQLEQRMGTKKHYTMFSHLRYQKSFNDAHNFSVMIGASQETQRLENIQGIRRGFASPKLDVLSGAPTDGQTNAGNIREFVLQSIFGRVTYDYKGKYLLEANFRRDGSSRFSEENRYGFFPSYSAGWRISEEAFLENASWLTNLKVRFSSGKMGNDQIGFYPYQSVIDLGQDYPYNGTLIGGGRRDQLANPNIRWEETKITDIGIDLNIKGDLFSMTLDYYDKTTDGILRTAQLPRYSGLQPPFVNEGVVNNKGIDLIMGHSNTIGDFRYGVNLNFSKYTNKLVKFGTRTFDLNSMIEGKEMDRYFMFQSDGIYQNQTEIDNGPTPRWPAVPGDLRYKDIDGDGAITPDDRVDVDGVNPDFFYGIEITANWKGFDFAIFFQGEQGRKVLVNNEWSLIMPFAVHGAAPIYWWDDSWTPENPSTTKPRMFYYGAPDGESIKAANTFWLREASYMRLKNLSIGYTLPSEVLEKVFLNHVRVFFNAENLATFSKFEFGDPERPSDNLYPLFRTLTLGTTIKF